MTTAPPPYSEAPSDAKTAMEKPSLDDKASVFTSDSSASSSTQRLVVKYNDWRARHGQIVDPNTSTPIYSVEHRYRKPTFALNAPDGREIATACSSKWTMKMDMEVAGQKFELTPRRKLSGGIIYPSPAFGQTLSWETSCRRGRVEYICLDENALPIARFWGGMSAWKCMSKGSFGDFEFTERVQTGAQRDEIVATGLTLAYKAAMNDSASTVVVAT